MRCTIRMGVVTNRNKQIAGNNLKKGLANGMGSKFKLNSLKKPVEKEE